MQPMQAGEGGMENTKAAFNALIENSKTPLTKESGCQKIANLQGDNTIGELLASLLSTPSGNGKNKYLITSRCMADKKEFGKIVSDIQKCELTLAEEADVQGEKVHTITTVSFSVGNDKKMIKDSMNCF